MEMPTRQNETPSTGLAARREKTQEQPSIIHRAYRSTREAHRGEAEPAGGQTGDPFTARHGSVAFIERTNPGAFYRSNGEKNMKLEQKLTWQTKARGTNEQEFEIFLTFANDGKGGDITNNGKPLPTFEEWLNR